MPFSGASARAEIAQAPWLRMVQTTSCSSTARRAAGPGGGYTLYSRRPPPRRARARPPPTSRRPRTEAGKFLRSGCIVQRLDTCRVHSPLVLRLPPTYEAGTGHTHTHFNTFWQRRPTDRARLRAATGKRPYAPSPISRISATSQAASYASSSRRRRRARGERRRGRRARHRARGRAAEARAARRRLKRRQAPRARRLRQR